MEDFEFKKYYQMIEDQKGVVNSYGDNLKNTLPPFAKTVASVISNIETRNNLLKEYIDDVHSFETGGGLTKPSDIFLGVRTAAEMADPEELKQKADKMKVDAAEIERLQASIESNQRVIVDSLKGLFGTLQEYLIQSDNIYSMSKDLLDKLNSIYDIAQIARNS